MAECLYAASVPCKGGYPCPNGLRGACEPCDVTHLCPPEGSGIMPCCGRTPLEVSRYHRITNDPVFVTCPPMLLKEVEGA